MSSVWEPVLPSNTGMGTSYGPTAARPTLVPYLYFEYFDTTLGFPVFATMTYNAGNALVWVNSSGVVV
jgi:hypothetical protein